MAYSRRDLRTFLKKTKKQQHNVMNREMVLDRRRSTQRVQNAEISQVDIGNAHTI